MQVTQRWLRMSGIVHQPQTTIRGVADLRHYNAEFVERGTGTPIVLVPGLAGGMDLLEPLAQELARQFRVITYQLRGECDCFALRQRFKLNDLADDLAEFITWQGLERPLVVGVSFGGVVALNAAARHPGLISALGVQGVGLRFESGLVHKIASLVLSSYPLPQDSPFVNQFFGVLFGHRPPPEQLAHATRACWQTDQSVMTYRLGLLRRLSVAAWLPRVTVPTLVISGGRDMIVSDRNSQALADALPERGLARLERAGHLAPVSHTAATGDLLRRFFEPATN